MINASGIVTDYMEFVEDVTYHDHYECPVTPTTHVMVNGFIGEGMRTERRRKPLP